MYATTSRRCADAPGEEQEVVDVFPVGLAGIALGGFRGELWICPGYKVTQGEQLRRNEEHTEPGVALVLGAGNQYPLVALDIFQMLVVQSRVVVCKMNPVNDYLGPFLREALAPLVREGFVEFVYGGAEVGSLLVHHPLIDPAGPLHIPPRAFEARMPDGGRVSHDGRDVPIIHVQACMVDGQHCADDVGGGEERGWEPRLSKLHDDHAVLEDVHRRVSVLPHHPSL